MIFSENETMELIELHANTLKDKGALPLSISFSDILILIQ